MEWNGMEWNGMQCDAIARSTDVLVMKDRVAMRACAIVVVSVKYYIALHYITVHNLCAVRRRRDDENAVLTSHYIASQCIILHYLRAVR